MKRTTRAVKTTKTDDSLSKNSKDPPVNKPKKNRLNFENLHKNLQQIKKDKEEKIEKEPLLKKSRLNSELEKWKDELIQLEDPPETAEEKALSASRLTYEFYNQSCEELAQNLLGKVLVRQLENGTVLKGRIVETESYIGGIDRASQTFQYKVTPRTIPMYMPPGTIYIYLTYGMYCCFNISSQGDGSAVLLRGLEPLAGLDQMISHRTEKTKSQKPKALKPNELCNGPSKLCIALKVDRDHRKYSLCTWKRMWIESDLNPPKETIKIVKCPRIGIDSAGPEWANKLLRFYIYGNSSVSKRDKKAEAALIDQI